MLTNDYVVVGPITYNGVLEIEEGSILRNKAKKSLWLIDTVGQF